METNTEGLTATEALHARAGLKLFAVYVALYAGFIALAVFQAPLMGRPLFGVNLAIVYGFGLIGAALLLAVVYMLLCSKEDSA